MNSIYPPLSSPPKGSDLVGLRLNPHGNRARMPVSEIAPLRKTSDTTFFENGDLLTGTPLEDEETSPLLQTRRDTSDVTLRPLFSSFAGSSSVSTNRKVSRLSDSLTEGIMTEVKSKGKLYWLKVLKVVIMLSITVLCCAVLISNPEHVDEFYESIATSVPVEIYSKEYNPNYPILQMSIDGPFDVEKVTNQSSIIFDDTNNHTFCLMVNKTALKEGAMAKTWHNFRCHKSTDSNCYLRVHVSEENISVPFVYSIHELSTVADHEILYAALVIIFVYILIIFDLLHRTLAAIIGALAALAVLAALNERPSIGKVISWMDMETLMLLFGMMIIVGVFSETGIFDFLALKAYQLAKGKVWPLVTLLCILSAVVSAFLDNVTTILLIAPVTIRLCEALNLDPRVILIAEVLFSNIGGTATAIGDPPNVIIVGSLSSQGITFTHFTSHMVIGILFIIVAGYLFMRLYYRNMQTLKNTDPPEITELNHEIEMWRRMASRLVVVTREETLMRALFLQKAVELENLLNKTIHRKRKADKKDLDEQFRQLEREYQIKDWFLLLKCTSVLIVLLTFFFMYSFVTNIHIGIGWIAVLGAILLLILADFSDLDSILHKVEWSTLIFFAALFILMEALAELRLIDWIGDQMSDMIRDVDEKYRLTAAVIIITWISALASSFIDNIPFTTAMVPVLQQLAKNTSLNLPLLPLAISLAFGACLGGNGTLIGASANVVCAGIAEQHGYSISFKMFFKVGFPMMLVTIFVSTVYLLICHVAIEWNGV